MAGRDFGSGVCPGAELKVYLSASAEVRAGRRASEPQGADTGAVAADIRRRDDADSTREASPLVEAAGAVVVDTSDLTVDQAADVIEEMLG